MMAAVMALLMALNGQDAQTIAGAVGAIATAGGGVIWVIRIEKDLMASYRSRMVELQAEIAQATKDRDMWRDRFYVLLRQASRPEPVSAAEIDRIMSDTADKPAD